MLPDLEHLIRLQQIDSFLESARRRVADHPALIGALDSKLAAATEAVATAKQRVADNRAARATVEKDLAMVQGRLSKFRDQLMEVKTNKEYQAMQKEIEVAQHDVRRLEDKILDHMVEADDLAAAVKKAEAALAADKGKLAEERRALEQEVGQLASQLEERTRERSQVAAQVSPAALSTYDGLMKGRKGLAVVETRDALCTACHVRVRPQVFNEIRRGDTIHQCSSCNRILFHVAPAGQAADGAPTGTEQ
jgi:uncharacterized protein